MSEIARLVSRIRAQLAVQQNVPHLDIERLQVEPVLNWGGFVNRSFRVSGGRNTWVLKLTADDEVKRGLGRWRTFADRLTERYHAPRMVGWLELDESYCGPLFEWIEGTPATTLIGNFGNELCRVIEQLHADDSLATQLADDGSRVESCARTYVHLYNQRFVEDLAFIEADPPPFVGPDSLAWMRGEAVRLAHVVGQLAAFQEAADRPVHADLWLNNTLLQRTGDWYLLDWDGLSLGDPVLDWSMLFGPTREHPRETAVNDVIARVNLTPSEQDRLAVYARAALLDWIIDPLADWVQAREEPEQGELVRAANERVHSAALQRYQHVYPL